MLEVFSIQYNNWGYMKKMSLDRFIFNYRRIYNQGQDLFNEFNPCDIKDGRCASGDFCCHGCDYLSEAGCRTQALWCKLWLCSSVVKRMDDEEWANFYSRLGVLKKEANELTGHHSGRYSLGQFILNIYGPEEFEKWKTTEASTIKASLKCAA